MTVIRATVRIRRNSGVAKNDSVNVLHFNIGALSVITDATADALTLKISEFYGAFAQYWAQSIDRDINSHAVDFAYLNSGAAGPLDDTLSPIIESRTFPATAWGAAGIANALPSECAVVLAYKGNVVGVSEQVGLTRPRSSRRGRMYLGPWNTTAMEQTALSHAEVSPALRTLIANTYAAMVSGLNVLTQPIYHVVYSPKTDSSYAVQSFHIDNAFDTMRSRGEQASIRTVGTTTQSMASDGIVPAA